MSTPTTVGGLAFRTLRMANGQRRQGFNFLAAAVDADDTTFTFSDDLGGMTVGSYLGVDEEIVYVRSVDVSAKSAVVRREQLGTTGASHLIDAPVQVDWRWFTADVVDAIADEVRSWPPDVFAVGEVDISVGAATTAIDVALTRYRYPLLLQRTQSGVDRWIDVTGSYDVLTNLPTSSFASGNALQLPSNFRGAGTVRLHYAQDFDVSAFTVATTLAAVGLPVTLHDAIIYGAAARLLIGDESPRSNTGSQPEPRQAADVRPGQAIQTGAAYRQLADQRVQDEAARLRSKYPYRRF
jgi:hypothetical protein